MLSIMQATKKARAELESITGSKVERVCGCDPAEDGWQLQMEVVELSRTPNTQDLLAMYDVQLDPNGAVTGFDRVAHRVRGDAFPEDRT
jgi:hypothetical protein